MCFVVHVCLSCLLNCIVVVRAFVCVFVCACAMLLCMSLFVRWCLNVFGSLVVCYVRDSALA